MMSDANGFSAEMITRPHCPDKDTIHVIVSNFA
jgi:hypothetical protein